MEKALLGSIALEDAAECLYEADRSRHDAPLPDYESDDAREMRVDVRYRIQGAFKRGDHMARLAVCEHIARVLALLHGDIWPKCDNRLAGIPDAAKASVAARRRQAYRRKAQTVCAEVARFYEIEQHTPESLAAVVEAAKRQQREDVAIVKADESRHKDRRVTPFGGAHGKA